MALLSVPKLGRVSEDAFVLESAVVAGQAVVKGDVLAVVQMPGQCVEIEAPESGRVVECDIRAGMLVQSGDILAKIEPMETEDGARDAAPRSADKRGGEAPDGLARAVGGSDAGRVVPILMPQAGQSMEEGTVVAWKVREGDRVQAGQVLCEIETDKAVMEMEATDAGRIAKIVAHEGDVVPVKQPIAFLAEDDRDIEAFLSAMPALGEDGGGEGMPTPVSGEDGGTVRVAPQVPLAGGRVKASPAARKMAKEKGIDLAAMPAGSGPGGRIISRDLTAAPVASPWARHAPAWPLLSRDLTASSDASPAPTGGGAIRRDMAKMRRAIARNLLWSKQNIPHFYLKATVESQALFALYKKTRESFKCTINDFVTRACALGVAEMPALRSRYQDDHIMEYPHANIGIAVGTEQGLTVPVVLEAERMSLRELAAKTGEVVANARQGKLEGAGQGVFTVTNMGMFGVEEFSAIVNPPESAILAVGAIREGVKVDDGALRATRLMTMVLSVDHRIVDGAAAAAFMSRVQALLEAPEQLV